MKKSGTFILVLLIFLAFNPLWADAEVSDNYRRGWHWYQEKLTSPDPEEKAAPDSDDSISSNDPIERMKEVQKTVKRALDEAVLNPSEENVRHYIMLQNQMMQQAGKFTHYWQAALLEHPSLDYSIKHPTNSLGRQVESDAQMKSEEAVLNDLAHTSGLFFFYRSSCPYCRKFAPIIKSFSDRYHIPVIAITTDGVSLPEFPDSVTDQGQSARFHVEVEPALFTVNPYTHKAYPVAYGLTSESEIRSNLLKIATHYQGDVS